MDLEQILNEALNEAMCNTNRIKNPNSNKVAQFVIDFLARKEFKSDLLHNVICITPICEGLTWGVSYKVLAEIGDDMYVICGMRKKGTEVMQLTRKICNMSGKIVWR